MAKQRKHYTPQEKVAVLRRHLLEHIPVSELCEELSLRPTVFYRWQKEFFENGAAAFGRQTLAERGPEQQRVARLGTEASKEERDPSRADGRAPRPENR